MKKITVLLGLVLVLGLVAPALADSQGFTGNVLSTADQGLNVYQRYFTPVKALSNPNGKAACVGARFIWDDANKLCQVKWIANGYRGYSEDISNYGGAQGNRYYVIWDAEKAANAAGHTGYYFCASKTVNVGGTHTWTAADCVGTNTASTCLGQGNTTNAASSKIDSTTQGTIDPLANSGFRPIPVPMPTKATNGVIPLTWKPADCVNEGGAISYDLYYVVDKNGCSAPMASALKFLKNVTDASTTVDVKTELGADSFDPATKACVTFALKLRYPSADTLQMNSFFFSANSQGVAFGGIAATVTNLAAKYLGKNNVEVSWKTSLEDGVQSFVVKRALLPNGPFQVVGTVPAKGQASTYSFIDSIQVPAGRVTTSGLYYKVETLDVDNNATAFGPVKAQLPVSTNRPVIIKEKPARKVQR